MSSKNDETTGMAVVAAFIITGVMLIAAAIFAIAAFLSFIFSLWAIAAWDRPVTIAGQTMTPEEARPFIYRGLIGAGLVPVFVLFCQLLFQIEIVWGYWPYMVIGGYTCGSIGIEYFKAQNEPAAGTTAEYIPPSQQLAPPKPKAINQPHQEQQDGPFRFASWDDEEAGR